MGASIYRRDFARISSGSVESGLSKETFLSGFSRFPSLKFAEESVRGACWGYRERKRVSTYSAVSSAKGNGKRRRASGSPSKGGAKEGTQGERIYYSPARFIPGEISTRWDDLPRVRKADRMSRAFPCLWLRLMLSARPPPSVLLYTRPHFKVSLREKIKNCRLL